jgi:hypothetical protein
LRGLRWLTITGVMGLSPSSIERGFTKIAVTGDSAGGNLALGLLASLKTNGASARRAIVGSIALSPVTDLSLSASGYRISAVVSERSGCVRSSCVSPPCRSGRAPSDPCPCGQRRNVARRFGPLRGACSGRRGGCTCRRVGMHDPWFRRSGRATASRNGVAQSDRPIFGRTICSIREELKIEEPLECPLSNQDGEGPSGRSA